MDGPESSTDWEELLLDNLRWVVRMIQQHRNSIKTIVVMGYARLTSDHTMFTEPLGRACQSWQIPMLYLHAGNSFKVERGTEDDSSTSFDCEFMTEVQVESGSRVPPLKVMIANDDPERFRFDRRK